jgi:hypothetical protein
LTESRLELVDRAAHFLGVGHRRQRTGGDPAAAAGETTAGLLRRVRRACSRCYGARAGADAEARSDVDAPATLDAQPGIAGVHDATRHRLDGYEPSARGGQSLVREAGGNERLEDEIWGRRNVFDPVQEHDPVQIELQRPLETPCRRRHRSGDGR